MQRVLGMYIENTTALYFGNDGKVFLVKKITKIAPLRKKGGKLSRNGMEIL